MTATTNRKRSARKRITEALVLRTCKADMTSHGGFKWPRRGEVECPDWNSKAECGNGLHGLLWGDGDGSLLNWDADAIWIVVAVAEDTIVEIGRKVKFPRGRVVFCGDRKAATDYILSHGAAARQKAVVGCSIFGGYGSTLTGGDRSTLTGGYWSTLTAGDGSTLTGGYWSTLTAGDGSTLTGGNWSTLNWKIWDGNYYRIHTVYVGENGIKANTPYRFVDGKAVEFTGD